LLEDYSKCNLTKDIYLKSKCSYNNCENNVSKRFRELEKAGSYCVNCIKTKANEFRKNTCLEKYGVENVVQKLEVKNKIKNTCIQKYGVETSFQSDKVKNKIKSKMIKLYGVENPNQSEVIKNKIRLTNLQKYGVVYSSQCKENRIKYKITCLQKYGVVNPSQDSNIKNKKIKTCLTNWGVENPSQNPEIMEKITKKSYSRKEYTFPSGKIAIIQGYENFALDNLIINEKINESDIIVGVNKVPEIWYMDDKNVKHRYYVDIYIPSLNKCIEVKSLYTYNNNKQINLLKKDATIKQGYDFEFWIYDNKGNRLNICNDKIF
jgi:hypothetical protein